MNVLVHAADAKRQEKQQNVVTAEEQLAAAEQRMQPLIESERNTKRLLVAKENAFNEALQLFNRKNAECVKLKNESIQVDENIEACRIEIRSIEQRANQFRLQIANLEAEAETKRVEYDDAVNSLKAKDADGSIKTLQQEIAKVLQPAADEAQDYIADAQANKTEQLMKLEGIGRQISSLQDPVKIWQNRILSNNFYGNKVRPMLQGMDWIRSHEAQLRADGKVL